MTKENLLDQEFGVEDEEYPFFMVTHAFTKYISPLVGPNGVSIYNILKYHANRKTGQCNPSLRRIAEMAGISVPIVLDSIRKLEKYNVIQCFSGLKEGQSNHYKIHSPKEWEGIKNLNTPYKDSLYPPIKILNTNNKKYNNKKELYIALSKKSAERFYKNSSDLKDRLEWVNFSCLWGSFSNWWQVYKHGNKLAAWLAWVKLNPSEQVAAEIMVYTPAYLANCEDCSRNVQYGATFLNSRQWENDLPEPGVVKEEVVADTAEQYREWIAAGAGKKYRVVKGYERNV
jgi:hypothetical protein